jgi:hypothetical protein
MVYAIGERLCQAGDAKRYFSGSCDADPNNDTEIKQIKYEGNNTVIQRGINYIGAIHGDGEELQ